MCVGSVGLLVFGGDQIEADGLTLQEQYERDFIRRYEILGKESQATKNYWKEIGKRKDLGLGKEMVSS